MNRIMIDYALEYAEAGYHVFPIKPRDKVPMTPNGHLDATTDPDQIHDWWAQWPDANIGIATGERSNLWVLDLDNKKSVEDEHGHLIGLGEHALRELEQRHERLPDTGIVATGGGGMHLYFTYPGGDARNRAGVVPGVDIRGEGGYVVAPPSLHHSGNVYRWAEERDPAPAPRWLVTLAATERRPVQLAAGEKVPEGERNEWLWRKACQLRGRGESFEDAKDIILTLNTTRLSPPGDPDKALDIVTRAYESYRPSVANIDFEDEESEATEELEEGEWLATNLDDFLTTPIPPPIPLVEGILFGGSGIILGGPPNVGKSWLAFDLGIAVATGTSWLGRQCEQGGVLYVDEEGSPFGDQRRLAWLLSSRTNSAAGVPFHIAVGKGFKLDNTRGETMIRRMVEQYRPKLVILDSMIRFHRGDENDAQGMARMFEVAKRIITTYETAVLFTHHVRKPGLENFDLQYALRGTGEMQAWPDTVLIAMPGSERRTLELHHTKARDEDKVDPRLVRVLVDKHLERAEVVDGGNLEDAKPDASIDRGNKVIAALANGPLDALDVSVAVGCTERTAKEMLRKLERMGKVVSVRGKYEQAEER